MSRWMEFIERELRFVNYDENSEKLLIALCKKFDEQDHSGMSASVVSSIFRNLLEKENVNSLEKAKDKIKEYGLFDPNKDFYGGMTGNSVYELYEVLFNHNNIYKISSEELKKIVADFIKLVKYEPISPLTGEDDEWMEIGTDLFQNRRCPSVFKDKNGTYQHNYYIFIDKNGGAYTCSKSRKFIKKFPYTPDHEYIKESEENCSF